MNSTDEWNIPSPEKIEYCLNKARLERSRFMLACISRLFNFGAKPPKAGIVQEPVGPFAHSAGNS